MMAEWWCWGDETRCGKKIEQSVVRQRCRRRRWKKEKVESVNPLHEIIFFATNSEKGQKDKPVPSCTYPPRLSPSSGKRIVPILRGHLPICFFGCARF